MAGFAERLKSSVTPKPAPKLTIVPPQGDDAVDEPVQAYQDRLHESGRDALLVAAIIALLAALRDRASTRANLTALRVIVRKATPTIAARVVGQVVAWLPAEAVLDRAALEKAARLDLTRAITGYLGKAIRTDKLTGDALQTRVLTIVTAEVQRVTAQTMKAAIGTQTGVITRDTTSALPCATCVGLAGDYPAPGDDDCWWNHPGCACVWSFSTANGDEDATMSTLNTAQRKALSLDSFGDPGRRLFPIVDQNDVDSAAHLIGKAKDPAAVKKRIIAIASRKKLKIPEAWETGPDTDKDTDDATMRVPDAVLSADGHVDGEMVTRTGLLFRAGDYPDQQLTVTPDELKAMADAFDGTGYVELEHFTSFGKDTILDGELGHVAGVWASDDGTELYGDVTLPTWLDTIAQKHGSKVSAVVNRAQKSLKGVGLVLEPQVADAALMAAFAKRHDTPSGQGQIQSLHDEAARMGAVCKQGNAGMASAHESSAIQQVHDITTQHGAACAAVGASRPMYAMYSKPKGKRSMNFKFWQKTTPEEREELRQAGTEVPDEAVFSTARALADAEIATERAKLQDQLRVEIAKRVGTEAAAFADTQIRESRAFPAERESIIAAFTQATMDDATHGVATFAGAAATSRVALLTASFAARPTHGLTKEVIDPKLTLQVVPAVFNADGSTPEDKALAPTKEGEAIAPERQAYIMRAAGIAAKN